MPLMNKNYVTPAWIDNAAPPINDGELNAMSGTLEGSQIIVGNGAPTSTTPGKVGQRYADISTTPPTMYVASAGFPGQPIPKLQRASDLKAGGFLVATGISSVSNYEIRVGSDNEYDVTSLVSQAENDTVSMVYTCKRARFNVHQAYVSVRTGTVTRDTYTNSGTKDAKTGLYYVLSSVKFPTTQIVVSAPLYSSLKEALDAAANPPVVWQSEADPNRNLAQEYSTGSSYAAAVAELENANLDRDLAICDAFYGNREMKDAQTCDLLTSWHIQEVVLPTLIVEEEAFDPFDKTQVDLSGIVEQENNQ